jgi:hypothetical protein
MFNAVYSESISSSLDGGGIELNVVQEETLAAALQQLGTLAALRGGADQIAPEIAEVTAQIPGLDPTVIQDAVQNAVDAALAAASGVEGWRQAPELVPDTPTLVGAIHETVLDLGLPEEYLMLAQSESFHTLIQLASQGQVNSVRGDMLGIGGLSEETYAELGPELAWEKVKNSAEGQMEALLKYIAIRHSGDPRAALEAYRRGDWGKFG